MSIASESRMEPVLTVSKTFAGICLVWCGVLFAILAITTPLVAQDTVAEVESFTLEQLSACATADSFSSDETRRILAIPENELFSQASYETLREIFSDRFERNCKSEIDAAWLPAFQAWISKHHPEKKQELFTSLNPKLDKVENALRVVNRLIKTDHKKSLKFWNLIIALAVTWDQPNNVYYYTAHADRSGGNLPEELANCSDNFKFFIDNETALGADWKSLPWEFLIFAVDHKTPVAEREWAIENFVDKRETIGECYSDVPYDFEMLKTKRRRTKLKGKQYTLPNVLSLGGVCAQQADFASRVGKSVGVPSAFVWGESTYGEMHSWVMWIQLARVAENQVSFSLKSHGRVAGDKYYVGILKEPRFGKRISDRQLELALNNVAASPQMNRHVERLVDSYELLAHERSFSSMERISFLEKILKLGPRNRRTWIQVAKVMEDSKFQTENVSALNQVVDKFMRTFSKEPDFTWMIFEKLIRFEVDLSKKEQWYRKLTNLYQQNGRPDLECNAKIAVSKLQIESGKKEDAIEGLAVAIMDRADDARLMPTMLNQLETICSDNKELKAKLVVFYKKFLPIIPQTRGKRPSPHCIAMYERGVATFRKAGDHQAAKQYLAKLRQLKSK